MKRLRIINPRDINRATDELSKSHIPYMVRSSAQSVICVHEEDLDAAAMVLYDKHCEFEELDD